MLFEREMEPMGTTAMLWTERTGSHLLYRNTKVHGEPLLCGGLHSSVVANQLGNYPTTKQTIHSVDRGVDSATNLN